MNNNIENNNRNQNTVSSVFSDKDGSEFEASRQNGSNNDVDVHVNTGGSSSSGQSANYRTISDTTYNRNGSARVEKSKSNSTDNFVDNSGESHLDNDNQDFERENLDESSSSFSRDNKYDQNPNIYDIIGKDSFGQNNNAANLNSKHNMPANGNMESNGSNGLGNGESGGAIESGETSGDMSNEDAEQAEDARSTANNAKNIRNAADVAIATKNPYAVAAGGIVKGADALTGGKSTEMLGEGMTQANKMTPGGDKIQDASNKLSESGASDAIGKVASMKSGGAGGAGAASNAGSAAGAASNAGNAASNAEKASEAANNAEKASSTTQNMENSGIDNYERQNETADSMRQNKLKFGEENEGSKPTREITRNNSRNSGSGGSDSSDSSDDSKPKEEKKEESSESSSGERKKGSAESSAAKSEQLKNKIKMPVEKLFKYLVIILITFIATLMIFYYLFNLAGC